jgi:TolB-like protein
MPVPALALAALLVLLGAAERPKLVVLALETAGGAEPEVASALSQAITAEAARRGYFEVISAQEVATLLGMERQRQLLGCSEDQSACLAELSGALGARFVLSGSLAKLGEVWQLSLQTLDSQRAQPVGRSTRLARELAVLRAQLPVAVAEATATPLPPPPSRLVPYSLLGAGAAAMVVGGLVGQDALGWERSVRDQLANDAPSAGVLRSYAAYQSDLEAISRRKTWALVGLAAGAAALGTGLYLMPSGVEGGFALVPTGTGVAYAGALP